MAKISDAIWNFAELGLQEFKSSALLIKTLEDEGFKIERNVALCGNLGKQKDHPYKSFLPEDAQPPLDLNKELMEKYRSKLDKLLGSLK